MFPSMNHDCVPSNLMAPDTFAFDAEADSNRSASPPLICTGTTAKCVESNHSFNTKHANCSRFPAYTSYSYAATHSQQATALHKPKLGTYEIDRTIGKGIFSVVKLARHTITGINLAVKIIDKTCLDADNLVKVYRESVILKKLHHPNIVKLYQVMETPRLLCLVMEYLPNGEVFDYIATHGRFSEAHARVKFLDVLSAIDYAHSCGIVHRDLKAENLLFDEDMNVKVIDFSFGTHHLASDTQSLLTTWCGSPPYAAPEIFKGEPYIGAKADIWSLGVVLYVMVCGMLPFDAQPLPHLKNQVLSASFRVPYWLSLSCERLIRWMLSKQPCKRPTTREIFQHPWFTDPLPPQCSANVDEYSCCMGPGGEESLERVTRGAPHLEPGSNLAADLELGRVNEFVLLLMESYGMSRTKIMESLNSRAYDHLMATYLLLGEKVRQHQFSLNLPALSNALMNSSRTVSFSDQSDGSIPINLRQAKHSRVDSAVGSVSETESNDLALASRPCISDSEANFSLVAPSLSIEHPTILHVNSGQYPLPCYVEPSIVHQSHVLTTTPLPTHLCVSPDPNVAAAPVTLTTAPKENVVNLDVDRPPWLSDLKSTPVTAKPTYFLPLKRTLTRRKYGVFDPPACLDALTRTLDQSTDETGENL